MVPRRYAVPNQLLLSPINLYLYKIQKNPVITTSV